MIRNLALASATLALATNAAAADVAFDNHLSSTPLVSPAQLYQVQELRTDAALSYVSTDDTATFGTTGNTANTQRDTRLFAGAVGDVRPLGLRAGLLVTYRSLAYEHAPSSGPSAALPSASPSGSRTELTATPTAAYPVGPAVFGLAYDLTSQKTSSPAPAGASEPASYGTLRPGLLLQADDLEVGLTGAFGTPRSVHRPASVTGHGRLALDRSLALGLILSEELWSSLHDGATRDRTLVKATAEHGDGPVKVEGDVGYATAFYAGSQATAATVGTLSLGGAGDFVVAKLTVVGVAFGYEFGSATADQYKVATNVVTVALRGDLRF